MTTPPKDTAPDIVGVPAAARLLGITPQAVRNHLRAGNLKGRKLAGKFGPEWHFRPGVLQAFAAERYGRRLDLDELQAAIPAKGGKRAAQSDASMADLYERILTLTAELADVRAISARAEGEQTAEVKHLQDSLAELRQERDAAQAKADEAAAELERVKSRGFFARLFGGNG